MDAQTAIRNVLATGEMIGMAYLGDLSDAELMQRPHAKCNHLNWQVGHLIVSENSLVGMAWPMPSLPAGFKEKYIKEAAASDDPSKFATKDELMAAYKTQRAATLEVLAKVSAEDLDQPSGVDYAPTRGQLISLNGEHWLMHAGQWVIVRRQNDKPVLI